MIPGINLLNVAMGLLGNQATEYLRFIGTETLANGVKIEKYEDAVPVDGGSVQPIPKSVYGERGLNLSREYVTWFVSMDVIGLDRDHSGDLMKWNGRTYKVDSDNSWYGQDGWCELVMWNIETKGATP